MTNATQTQTITLPDDMPSFEKTRRHDRVAMASLAIGLLGSLAIFFIVAVPSM